MELEELSGNKPIALEEVSDSLLTRLAARAVTTGRLQTLTILSPPGDDQWLMKHADMIAEPHGARVVALIRQLDLALLSFAVHPSCGSRSAGFRQLGTAQ